MRLTLSLLLIAVFTFASEGFSQSAKLKLKMENATLVDIFQEIERTSDIGFLFKNEQLDLDRKYSVDAENKSVEDILKMLLGDKYNYQFIGNNVVITAKNEMVSAGQQQKSVIGKVTDSSGASLPGVTVVVKGTTQGTIADADGNYTLANVPDDATLVFSFVGMKAQEIAVDGKNQINVAMAEESIGLDEVVAIGYGTMKKSDLTGSVSSVSSDQLDVFPTRTVQQALQGRAAGVHITSTNGAPGSEIRVRVRGGTSINASSDPLYVVDGFAGANLPPAEDIQSIEILKDASATAIYGARGANGVIMITTKKGDIGELKIEANTSYSVQQIGERLNLLNAQQFAEFQNDYFQNVGLPGVPYPNPSAYGEGTDWQDVIFRTGNLQNHQIAVSGGTEKIRFYSSAKYYRQKGSVINSEYESFNGRIRLDINYSEKLKLGTQMQFICDDANIVPTQNGIVGDGIISSALTFEPTLGIFDSDGNYTTSNYGDPKDNPYNIATNRIEKSAGNYFLSDVFLDYNIFKDLKFHTSFGANINTGRTGLYLKKSLIDGANANGLGSISNTRTISIINENYFTYTKSIADLHKFTFMTGYSYQLNRYEYAYATNQGFITDSFLFWNLGAGTDPLSPSSSLTEWEISSFYGRLNYNLNDRYLLTFTGRYDGSSRFGANNKWAFFPSAAFAWNIKQEPFMKQIEKLSHLKLRASYGVIGNTEIGAYNSLARLNNVIYTSGGEQVNAVIPVSVANSDLSWESTAQTDIGLDIGFFKGKLNITADYYSMETKDLLYSVPLPYYSGYTSTLSNWGKVRNRGIEFSFDAVIADKGIKWNADFNISFNRNKIIELPGGDVIWNGAPDHMQQIASTHIRTVGQPLGAFYGYVFDGVYQENDDFSAEPKKVPGSIKYKDTNGRDENGNLTGIPDGSVNSDDRAIVGDPNPDFIFGFTNSFKYRNFDLSIFINGSVGNDMINFTRMELETMNGFTNTTTAYLEAWTPSHTDTDIPSVGKNNWEFSSRWVENGSYIRFKDISFGYSLSSYLLDYLKINKLRVYLSAQNLFTITKYSGFDPEVSWRDSNNRFGCDYGSYPNVKSFTVGMNIIF